MANEELVSKLKAFALMLKYGHDLFDAASFQDAAALAVNNSRLLLNFRTATLLEYSGGKAVAIAQYGQPEANAHSRLAVVQAQFVESLGLGTEPLTVSATDGLPAELAADDAVYCCLKLRPPANLKAAELSFVWLLEYGKTVPAHVPNTFKLLAASASEALYYQRFCRNQLWEVRRHVRKRWGWGAVLLLAIAAMFLRVPESATAEFTLKAPEITSAYA